MIWKPSDGETWMMTIDHLKPTTALIPFTMFCDVDFKKKQTTSSNRVYEGILINIDE
jgi:hypothetical protein